MSHETSENPTGKTKSERVDRILESVDNRLHLLFSFGKEYLKGIMKCYRELSMDTVQEVRDE